MHFFREDVFSLLVASVKIRPWGHHAVSIFLRSIAGRRVERVGVS